MIVRWKLPKGTSQMITFLFSAVLHEFLLAMIFRIVRPIFLAFIVGQVPLIYLTKFMRGKKSGSLLFWFGIISGPSIIVASYLRVHEDVVGYFTRV
jgi:sterol O-acyltransferase